MKSKHCKAPQGKRILGIQLTKPKCLVMVLQRVRSGRTCLTPVLLRACENELHLWHLPWIMQTVSVSAQKLILPKHQGVSWCKEWKGCWTHHVDSSCVRWGADCAHEGHTKNSSLICTGTTTKKQQDQGTSHKLQRHHKTQRTRQRTCYLHNELTDVIPDLW